MINKKRSMISLLFMALIIGLLGTPIPSQVDAQDDCVNTHTVFDGDTLIKISNQYNVDINELATVNEIENPSVIYIGDVLCLDGLVVAQPDPEGDDSGDEDTVDEDVDETPSNGVVVDPDAEYTYLPPAFEPKANLDFEFDGLNYRTDNQGYYTVRRGDTFYRIALAFGVNDDRLAAVNGIEEPGQLQAGTRLFIPQPISYPAPLSFPEVTIWPRQAGPGDTVLFEGFGFPAESTIEVYFEKQSQNRISDMVTTVETDEDGYFAVEVEIISEWTNGDALDQRTVSISAYTLEYEYFDYWAMNFFINEAYGN